MHLNDCILNLKESWKKSRLFKWIDSIVSLYFRARLKNDNFTILCSNCVGGVLYHRLGKPFLSPTINMWFRQVDFLAFCVYLDYYLAQELHFIETDMPHPVALLLGNGEEIPDITLFFNHDKEPETAREKWERRKSRIVRDNLYIMLYYLDGITEDQLKKLESVPCKNKVVFTAKPLSEISWSVFIKPNLKHHYPFSYLEKDAFGVRYIEKKFDFVTFLNSAK